MLQRRGCRGNRRVPTALASHLPSRAEEQPEAAAKAGRANSPKLTLASFHRSHAPSTAKDKSREIPAAQRAQTCRCKPLRFLVLGGTRVLINSHFLPFPPQLHALPPTVGCQRDTTSPTVEGSPQCLLGQEGRCYQNSLNAAGQNPSLFQYLHISSCVYGALTSWPTPNSNTIT